MEKASMNTLFERLLNVCPIRGWSVVAVAMVLAMIAVLAAMALTVAWWINPRSLVLVAPLVALGSWKIWRVFE